MVMGRDSSSESRGFESWHRILDGFFSTYIFCKNCNDVCLKRPKINEKEAGIGPFFKKNIFFGHICGQLFPWGKNIFEYHTKSSKNLAPEVSESTTTTVRLNLNVGGGGQCNDAQASVTRKNCQMSIKVAQK